MPTTWLSDTRDERTITAVMQRFEHRDQDVRQAAVEALGVLAEKGDERTIDACYFHVQAVWPQRLLHAMCVAWWAYGLAPGLHAEVREGLVQHP